nr:MAG TPA: hypothetical protein [Caudoviricetes sp.]
MTQETEKVNYRISENRDYSSREVYFDGKPSEAVRTALKALKMRWHGVKKCWYGYATESALIAAILGASGEEEPGNGATVYTDGYLGGGAVYGNKSGKYLYGSELSAAIRADLKRAGIKGVTVSCKTYSGGQNITATIKAPAALLRDRSEYIADYRVSPSMAWIYTGDGQPMHCNTFWALDAAEQERLRAAAAAYSYDCAMTRDYNTVNQYHIDGTADFLNADGLALVKRVNDIIRAYHYDKSNSMVDYFDTNFYYDLHVKAIPAAQAA